MVILFLVLDAETETPNLLSPNLSNEINGRPEMIFQQKERRLFCRAEMMLSEGYLCLGAFVDFFFL